MKSILIFSHAMEIGGAEKALLGLLETVDTSKYEVDLFLMRHEGELYRYIPKNINVLQEKPEYASLAVPITEVIKKHQFRVVWARLIGKIRAAKRVRKLNLADDNDVALEYSHKYTVNLMPEISKKEYDLAVSFLTPHYYVAQKVRAKRKIAWIHTDYSVVAVDRESQLQMWKPYDVIASISESVTRSFLQQFPELKAQVQEISNIMPIKYMKEMAEAFVPTDEMVHDGTIRLLSIGRFCTAKNFDNVPFICKALRQKGLNVKWYLIGFGSDENLIREKIAEVGMQDYVIILGKKENPYPYIKACDIYVQPSRYEGKSISVIEAQILHKPVVITNYATSASQLKDGIDGVIVPMENQKCAEGIADFILDGAKRSLIVAKCNDCDYSNSSEISKLYSLC